MAGPRTQNAPPDSRADADDMDAMDEDMDDTADTADTDDALLAVRAAEGDEDAFAVLVHRHAPALIRLATSLLGTGAEAEDAVQDAFLSAWRRLPEFQGAQRLRHLDLPDRDQPLSERVARPQTRGLAGGGR